jgi:hypothetical protein
MKKTASILFFMACFLCSWVLRAAHEDKREANGSARGRIHPVSEGERETPGETVDEGSDAERARPEANRTASSPTVALGEKADEGVLAPVKFVPAFSVADWIKEFSNSPERMRGILRLSLNPFPLDLIREFWRFSTVETLSMDRSNFEEVVIPFTDGLRHFSALKRLEIYRSDLGDSMLFFLGIQLPKLPGMREIVFEANRVFTIGVKSFFLGLPEMPQLDRFSWRHMPHNGLIPWEVERLQKRDGYKIEEAVVQIDEKTPAKTYFYIQKTPLRFLIEDALPRLLYLRHLDLGGSIVVKNERSRKELMDLFSLLPSIIRLESLGLSQAVFDEFSARALSRALVRLAENQMLHSEEENAARLQELDLDGVLVDGENLKDLEHGLKESRYLEKLNLANNQITDRVFAHLLRNALFQMKKLEVLNLSGNPLTDKSIDFLGELTLQNTNLKRVILSQTQITPGKLAALRETGVEFVIA